MTATFPQSQFTSVLGDEREPALLTLRERIAGIAQNVEAPFIAAGSLLMEVVEALDRIINELDVLSQAIDRPAAITSVTDLKRVAERLMRLPEAHAARLLQMKQVADAAQHLGSNIGIAGRSLRLLDIFAMNISVASEGEPEFAGFVREMSKKLGERERDLAAMSDQLAQLSNSVTGMLSAGEELAAESRQVIPHVPSRLIHNATTLDEHLDASAVAADQVAATARRIRDQVAVMLGAMQVGDRTRQRLEHIAVGLDMAHNCTKGGDDATAIIHFERLLGAQIEATAAEFYADTTLLTQAFGALQPDTQLLLELMDERTGTHGAGAIEELKQGIADVMKLTTRVCAADDKARAMGDIMAAAITDLSQRLDGVRRLRSNVQIIATNIAIMCRRHGTIGRGISTIADQIDIQAAALPQLTENIAAPIAALVIVREEMRQEQDRAATIDATTVLSNALSILSDAAQRSEAASQHTCSGDGRRVISAIQSAAGRIEHDLAENIRECGHNLRAKGADAQTTDNADISAIMPLMQRLHALYTMAQEREIHARFLPPSAEVSLNTMIADDDDDDGLF